MSTTTPTGLHEYECQPGTPLHSVLVGAVANKATAVHIWEQASTTHMMMLPGMEDRPVDSSPAEMVAGLLARPPVGMTNFDEIVLHALGMRTHGNQDLFNTGPHRVTPDPMAPHVPPRRSGPPHPTLHRPGNPRVGGRSRW